MTKNKSWPESLVDLGTLRLRHPITIQIEDHGTEMIASWPEVELWGAGNTDADAMDALKDAIITLYRDLANTPDDLLGTLPLRWKRTLEALFCDTVLKIS